MGRLWLFGAALAAGCSAAPEEIGIPTRLKSAPVPRIDLGGYDPLAGTTEETLPNGLKVIYKRDPTVPMVSTAIGYRVGGANETEGVTGVAHFLEHMMFDGTDIYDKNAIDAITFQAAGSNNAMTSEDNTVFFFRVASEKLEEVIKIEANRMTQLKLDEKMFEIEKQSVLEEMNRDLDKPWGKVFQERDRIMFSRHPYHHPVIGWRQDVQKLTREQMIRFYRDYYAPNNAVLVVSGDFDPARASELVRKHFGSLSRGKEPPEISVTEPEQREARRQTYQVEGQSERLAVAWKTVPMGSPDDHVLDVVATLLSGSRSSRLIKRIVEADGLASEGAVQASHESRKHIGIFCVTVEPQEDASSAKAEEAIFDEVSKLAEKTVKEEELRKAKNITSAHFVFDNEGQQEMAIQIASVESIGAPNYLREYVRRVEKITASEVRDAVRKYLGRSQSTVIVAAKKGGAKSKPQRRLGRRTAFPIDSARATCRRTRPARPWTAASASRLAPAFGQEPATRGVADSKTWEVELSNGLCLIAHRRASAPVIAVRFWVNDSEVWEPENKAGVTHMTGALLDEGTLDPSGIQMDHDEISDRIESLGATITTGSGGVAMKGLAQHRSVLFEMLKQVVLYPTFPEERMKMVRTAMLDEIAHRKDDPEAMAADLFRERVYAGHPRHRPDIGYQNTVEKLTRDDVLAHYKKFYRPDNAILVVTGDVDPPAVVSELGALFADWVRKDDLVFPELPAPPPPKKALVVERRETLQVNIVVGALSLTRADPEYYAARVAETILCDSPVFSDRMSKAVRVEEGKAYSISGTITQAADVWPGAFSLYLGTRAAEKDRAIEIVERELERFVKDGPTEQELADAKNFLIRSFYAGLDTTSELSSYLLAVRRWNLGPRYARTFRRKISAVTIQDIKRVAKKYVDPGRLMTVLVGPLDLEGRVALPKEK